MGATRDNSDPFMQDAGVSGGNLHGCTLYAATTLASVVPVAVRVRMAVLFAATLAGRAAPTEIHAGNVNARTEAPGVMISVTLRPAARLEVVKVMSPVSVMV